MNVESLLKAKIPGYPFTEEVLSYAAASPIFAEPPLLPLNLSDDVTIIAKDSELKKSLKYAVSTLYYAVAGVFAGGSKSEQVGDVKVAISGFTITQQDREYYRGLADDIRDELGLSKNSNTNSQSGMINATPLRRR